MKEHIEEARDILRALGFPRRQTGIPSARVLLALLNLKPGMSWSEAANPILGIWPIIQWIGANLDYQYAVGSREGVRKSTIHQFVAAGLVIYHDGGSVNSPEAGYQIEPTALALLRSYNSSQWANKLAAYLVAQPGLAEKYARRRAIQQIPVLAADGAELRLSPGAHSELIRDIIEKFAPRFVPGCRVVYVGDTGKKHAIFDIGHLAELGVVVDKHGKLPDVVLHYTGGGKNWLVLAEACSSVGPVDGKRYGELTTLFANAKPGLVFVSAFPSREIMRRYLADIAWETEAWAADEPDHLTHFNGERFLGPYT